MYLDYYFNDYSVYLKMLIILLSLSLKLKSIIVYL